MTNTLSSDRWQGWYITDTRRILKACRLMNFGDEPDTVSVGFSIYNLSGELICEGHQSASMFDKARSILNMISCKQESGRLSWFMCGKDYSLTDLLEDGFVKGNKDSMKKAKRIIEYSF